MENVEKVKDEFVKKGFDKETTEVFLNYVYEKSTIYNFELLNFKMDAFKAESKKDNEILNSKIENVRTDLNTKIESVRTELKTDIESVRTELKTDIENVRTELKTDIAFLKKDTKAEFKELRNELKMGNRVLGALILIVIPLAMFVINKFF